MDTLTIVLIVFAVVIIVIVAIVALSTDIVHGAIGGRQTLERARKLLIVSTDEPTRKRADEWVAQHRKTHPDVECINVDGTGEREFDVYRHVQEAIDADKPDAVVWSLHDEGTHHPEEGPYAMAKRELNIPMDAIFVAEAGKEVAGK